MKSSLVPRARRDHAKVTCAECGNEMGADYLQTHYLNKHPGKAIRTPGEQTVKDMFENLPNLKQKRKTLSPTKLSTKRMAVSSRVSKYQNLYLKYHKVKQPRGIQKRLRLLRCQKCCHWKLQRLKKRKKMRTLHQKFQA